MAWVSVHDHVIGGKLRELSKEIGCSQKEALGILISLWLWGLNNADKTGELMSADKEDVADALGTGLSVGLSPMHIVDCLIKTRWMDEPEPGSLYIHDWDQWQEQWFKFQSQKEYDAKRKREARAKQKQAPSPEPMEKPDRPQDCPSDSPPDNPPDDGKNEMDSSPKSRYSKGFEEFWKVYPRRVDKGNAYKKYSARLKDGYSEEELLLAATRYSEQCLRDHTEDRYIKHPKTFLSDALPFLDFLDKKDGPPEPPAEPGANPFARYKRGDDDDD